MTSGSASSPSAVEPTRSQKRTVTVLRTATGEAYDGLRVSANQRDAVAHRKHRNRDPRVAHQAVVHLANCLRALRVVALVDHAAAPERVVERHQAAGRQAWQERLVVVQVVHLVRVDEDEVELALE